MVAAAEEWPAKRVIAYRYYMSYIQICKQSWYSIVQVYTPLHLTLAFQATFTHQQSAAQAYASSHPHQPQASAFAAAT